MVKINYKAYIKAPAILIKCISFKFIFQVLYFSKWQIVEDLNLGLLQKSLWMFCVHKGCPDALVP